MPKSAKTGEIHHKKRNIDIVFCIDGTGSMSPCINVVKKNAVKFKKELSSEMTYRGDEIDSVRIKVIVFRDYGNDADGAMIESIFYELPGDDQELTEFVNNITAYGGGDAPENGLESLYYAMKSDFTTGKDDRQIIVLFTDATAHKIGKFQDAEGYPHDMVKDESELVELWSGVNQDKNFKLQQRLKRLVIFAPPVSTSEEERHEEGLVEYEDLAKRLNKVWFSPVAMDAGLREITFDRIIRLIADSAE